MFSALCRLLLAFLAARFPRKEAPITVEFCEARDHAVICVDGIMQDLVDEKLNGIYMVFELWATEAEVRAHLNSFRAHLDKNLVPTGYSPPLTLVMSAALGQKGLNLVMRMRHNRAFADALIDRIIDEFRKFKADPEVKSVSQYYREQRSAVRAEGIRMSILFLSR